MDWTTSASCAGIGSEMWFSIDPEDSQLAIEVCRACKVRVECLEMALDFERRPTNRLQPRWGVWGGTTPRQRLRLEDQRREQQQVRERSEA